MLSIDVFVQILADIIENYGYLGIFIVSLVSNSIPYVSLPYLALLVFTAPILNTPLTITLAITASALGATIGKLIILSIGRVAHIMLSDEAKDNLMFFNKLFRKWGVIAVFLFAALPLPDDVLYIPLGVAGYRAIPYTIAVFMGKIVVTGMAVFFGKAFVSILEETFKTPLTLSLTLLLAVTLIISYVAIKINWKIVFESYHDEGIVKGTWRLIDEIAKIFKLR
ncbi:MAG: VTT domain-containing protein [Candidatus Methanomethylicia archaeon]